MRCSHGDLLESHKDGGRAGGRGFQRKAEQLLLLSEEKREEQKSSTPGTSYKLMNLCRRREDSGTGKSYLTGVVEM